ncbi:hypothetical protein HPB49_012212 [Dermacentor silvarum]|uniref:Uncharacterized protein n=1 Tax=Dermacentor silvarum TaxID=543639 RepID=A0ACB8C3H3_DERSI|nr:hypothetical protein HPB49_012212 [Dermacentor silvarum]
MDEMKRHGGLVVDEMKLSAHLDMRSSGHIEGFVDLGKYTEDCDKHTKADHRLVVMLQPFIGKWTQVVAVFASRGNVKSKVLAKILLEATILCKQAGLQVDHICSDGASWNRSMWNAFGLRGTFKDVRCKVIHPSDPSRFLHFVSDFPHLIKPGSAKEAALDQMMEFMDSWENHSKGLGSRFISFCSLARSPKGGNVSDDVLECLLSVEQLLPKSDEQTEAGDTTKFQMQWKYLWTTFPTSPKKVMPA